MWLRLTALVVLLVAAAVVASMVGLPDPAQLRADIEAVGPLAPALFVLVYSLVTLAPLPKNVFAVAAGLMFGLVVGVAVVLVAAMIGALAAFGLGRLLGRDAVERITGTRVARVDDLLRRRGMLAVLGVRLVPVLPFTAINYAAGLTAVRLRDYVVGTALGMVPGTISFTALGVYGSTPASWPFVLAVVALVALTAGAAVLVRRRGSGRTQDATESAGIGAGNP